MRQVGNITIHVRYFWEVSIFNHTFDDTTGGDVPEFQAYDI
jgi:hypothetical protein